MWLVTDGAPLPKALEPGLQQATVLRVDAAALAQWLEPEAGMPCRTTCTWSIPWATG